MIRAHSGEGNGTLLVIFSILENHAIGEGL